MPLHLLGKKSWNVYNRANIENVRRDEAIAKAAEEAEEERMQAIDAERRMQLLRGEALTPLSEMIPSSDAKKGEPEKLAYDGKRRIPRKKVGENDVDYEIRVAREQLEAAAHVDKQRIHPKGNTLATTGPLRDSKGFFSIFPENISNTGKLKKNPEAEKEAANKKREYEDQYTMRFSNAAGLRENPGEKPWYSKAEQGYVTDKAEVSGRDVWGNKDPRRQEREQKRVVSNDPLALMKAGARKAREVQKERQRWKEDVDRGERQLIAHGKRKRRRSHHRDSDDFTSDGLRVEEYKAEREKREDCRGRWPQSKHRKRETSDRHDHG